MSTILPPQENNKIITTAPQDQSGQMGWLTALVYGVLVIISLTFITLLFNYYQQSAVSYEGLHDQVLLQNQKIDYLTQAIKSYQVASSTRK